MPEVDSTSAPTAYEFAALSTTPWQLAEKIVKILLK